MTGTTQKSVGMERELKAKLTELYDNILDKMIKIIQSHIYMYTIYSGLYSALKI